MQMEILHDHYKETFSYIREYSKLRGRYFAALILVNFIFLFRIFSPDEAAALPGVLLAELLHMDNIVEINTLFVWSILWFVFMALANRYFALVVLVDRQYDYLHKLENYLSDFVGNNLYRREGHEYLSTYPKFLNWVNGLYKIIFPIVLLLLPPTFIIWEFVTVDNIPATVLNTAFALLLVISTGLSMHTIHFRD